MLYLYSSILNSSSLSVISDMDGVVSDIALDGPNINQLNNTLIN